MGSGARRESSDERKNDWVESKGQSRKKIIISLWFGESVLEFFFEFLAFSITFMETFAAS